MRISVGWIEFLLIIAVIFNMTGVIAVSWFWIFGPYIGLWMLAVWAKWFLEWM